MTALVRRMFPAEISEVGENEVQVVISTSALAADGDIWMTQGVDLTRYRANPIWLWDHQPQVPIGRGNTISIDGDKIVCRVGFAPPGISAKADEIRGLVKAGIINGVSAGALPLELEPLDPNKPRGGKRWLSWELYECSFVAVPSNMEAMVTQRAAVGEGGGQGPAEPVTNDKTRGIENLRKRMLVASPKLRLRGLYDCAQLAYVLDQLGYLHSSAAWEAECEADDSKVPAMIGEAMKAAGDTLVAMTAEEVAELLDSHGVDGDGDDDALPAAERAFVAGAPAGRRRLWRRAFAHMRMLFTRAAGDGSMKTLQDAAEHHTRALERNGNTRDHLEAVGKADEAIADSHTRALAAHDRAGDAINDAMEAANGSAPAAVTEEIAKVQNQHRAIGKHLDAIGEQRSALAEAHGNAANTAQLAHRSIRAAQRCVRSLLDTTDGEAATVPTDAEGTAAARSAAFRRRQVAVAELAEAP